MRINQIAAAALVGAAFPARMPKFRNFSNSFHRLRGTSSSTNSIPSNTQAKAIKLTIPRTFPEKS